VLLRSAGAGTTPVREDLNAGWPGTHSPICEGEGRDAAPAEGGLRSALVNTFHELGGAVGVAVLSSAAGVGLVMAHRGSRDFARAFAVGAAGAAVCLAITAVLVPAVLRKPAG
jgi:hypothetical protein